jgi:hypothetical protein
MGKAEQEMKVFAFVPRYWFHSFMSGARRQSYPVWRRQIIDADYTVAKTLRHISLSDDRFLWDVILFLITLAWVGLKRVWGWKG